MSVNKVILLGNLGKDPEVRHTQTGKVVCNFSVATSKKWESGEKTEWHNIVVWGKLAEICGQYIKKGSKVYLEGELQTRSYEKDGITRYNTEINAFRVEFLDKRTDAGSGNAYGEYEKPRQQTGYQDNAQVARNRAYGHSNDEDIPF